jgi:hypothetical protein
LQLALLQRQVAVHTRQWHRELQHRGRRQRRALSRVRMELVLLLVMGVVR